MKVCGFTFIRNAIQLDYPVAEAIKSILPLCDGFVVAVGHSDDGTRDLIQSLSKKITIIDTVWDDSLRVGGKVLADETNKAFQAIPKEYDWCFYIQGDEVMHEKYVPVVKNAMEKFNKNSQVDGLLFQYLHFYGSYDFVGVSSGWYTHEIRVIKNNKKFYSYRDAQGFRKDDNLKLNVKPIDAFIYHYGWVREPEAMQRKQESFHRLWHDDQWMEEKVYGPQAFDYAENMQSLKRFEGTHPSVMKERIKKQSWSFDFDPTFNTTSVKDKVKNLAKKYLGWDWSYKNYRKV